MVEWKSIWVVCLIIFVVVGLGCLMMAGALRQNFCREQGYSHYSDTQTPEHGYVICCKNMFVNHIEEDKCEVFKYGG